MGESRHFKSFHYETALEWQRAARALAMLPGAPPLMLSTPEDLGGEPGRWTPEQLLLSAVESCTLFTLLAEAARANLEIVSWESTAEGVVARDDAGRFRFVQVVVRPVVEVRSAEDAERARALLQRVEKQCFIANSLIAEPRIEARVEVAAVREEAPELGSLEGPTS